MLLRKAVRRDVPPDGCRRQTVMMTLSSVCVCVYVCVCSLQYTKTIMRTSTASYQDRKLFFWFHRLISHLFRTVSYTVTLVPVMGKSQIKSYMPNPKSSNIKSQILVKPCISLWTRAQNTWRVSIWMLLCRHNVAKLQFIVDPNKVLC